LTYEETSREKGEAILTKLLEVYMNSSLEDKNKKRQ
jgi:hypothetical protein